MRGMGVAGWGLVWVGGAVGRLVDRGWFLRGRPRGAAGAAELVRAQRRRVNDVTPVLLVAGVWAQVVAGWGLAGAAGGGWWWGMAAAVTAVQFRHLQEISHFAVHGVLARSRRVGEALAEAGAHHPLGLVPVPVRRRTHVREHHPNAAVRQVDPNLGELEAAGLRPGVGGGRFALALVHPLTPRGVLGTVRGVLRNVRPTRRADALRAPAVVAVAAVAYAASGGSWAGSVFGYLLPRVLLYPMLAWLSLLVEHTWFDPDPRTGRPARVEAGRCLRLYPRNRALAAFAAVTWLPYGDLRHFAHSAHPAIRWNYLPALERRLGVPHFTPRALALATSSVVARHRRALG